DSKRRQRCCGAGGVVGPAAGSESGTISQMLGLETTGTRIICPVVPTVVAVVGMPAVADCRAPLFAAVAAESIVPTSATGSLRGSRLNGASFAHGAFTKGIGSTGILRTPASLLVSHTME